MGVHTSICVCILVYLVNTVWVTVPYQPGIRISDSNVCKANHILLERLYISHMIIPSIMYYVYIKYDIKLNKNSRMDSESFDAILTRLTYI